MEPRPHDDPHDFLAHQQLQRRAGGGNCVEAEPLTTEPIASPYGTVRVPQAR
jgi:hypothetical protein